MKTLKDYTWLSAIIQGESLSSIAPLPLASLQIANLESQASLGGRQKKRMPNHPDEA
jgi:hypothetical protein